MLVRQQHLSQKKEAVKHIKKFSTCFGPQWGFWRHSGIKPWAVIEEWSFVVIRIKNILYDHKLRSGVLSSLILKSSE